MKNSRSCLLLLCLLLILAGHDPFLRRAEAGKRRVQIPDDLDDVVDDEEDDSWREWGKKSPPSDDDEFDPPPDFSAMDMSQIQAEMMKRQTGPVFGFAKLRLGVKRTPEMVTETARKWSKLSRTGAIDTRFTAFDRGTIMFSMERGQDTQELKDFILSQPEAYEIKIGDQLYRRPGDPPLEQLVEKLRIEKNRAENTSPSSDRDEKKAEL